MAPSIRAEHPDRRRGCAAVRRWRPQRVVEGFRRGPHAEPREPRDEIGQADDIEWIKTAARREVTRGRRADRFRIAEPIGKDAAEERVERDAAHLGLDLPHAAVRAALQALDERGGDARHRLSKSRRHLPTEHRRQQAP
jgi:hypothetical protein